MDVDDANTSDKVRGRPSPGARRLCLLPRVTGKLQRLGEKQLKISKGLWWGFLLQI